ncbi:hypotheical protein [Mycobacterium phage PP]|uniref:Hypotheical protein n=1 Tax=Mycobacterium phage PP TaxID=2077134 RepID=A0A2Z5XVG0_9CAUD|nr:hypothetical protein KIW36_gp49 [Mycobacterium phage PP]BBC53842.1 hypotheical protein [Mycobacterium phage PP]
MTPPTKQQETWDWLKAEKRYHEAERRSVRDEGVPEHVLRMRRKGVHIPAPRINRASRRALLRRLKGIA